MQSAGGWRGGESGPCALCPARPGAARGHLHCPCASGGRRHGHAGPRQRSAAGDHGAAGAWRSRTSAGVPRRSGRGEAATAPSAAAGAATAAPPRASWERKSAGHRPLGSRHSRRGGGPPAEGAGSGAAVRGAVGRGRHGSPSLSPPQQRRRPPGSWGPAVRGASGRSSGHVTEAESRLRLFG